ncbi:MAG TPA: aspartate aminotransferase family protein [Phycisphaerae bacterium]|nr:aspartate aminotransferase family protein [Phycisphaerae bacterium]
MTIPSTHHLADLDRQFLWHPFTPMKPWCEEKEIITIARGQDEFLFDTDGRRYIDGVSSLWCNIHGHNVPELNAALTDQLHKIAHTTLLGLANIPATLLAERLVTLARSRGLALDKCFYSDNGSTAVEVACKMAFQYWRNRGMGVPAHVVQSRDRQGAVGGGGAVEGGARSRFIALSNAYHGDTLGAVSLGGIPLFHHTFRGLTFPVDFVPPPTHANTAATLAAINSLLSKNPDTYAAIIIEPLIQGAGGMLMHPPQFLRDLRTLANQHNTLLIFDEVLTAFGRTGTMFAAEHANTQSSALSTQHSSPDFLCLSKGLTAGYLPLGATLTTQKIFDAFYVNPNLPENAAKTFFHGHTFTGHPLACAVALASLDLFDKSRLLDHVNKLAPLIAEALEPLRQKPFVKDIRHLGLVAAIDIADEAGNTFPYHWRVGGELCRRMRPLGLMMRPLADTLVIMPPLAIREENLRHLLHVVVQSIDWIPAILAQKRREVPP